ILCVEDEPQALAQLELSLESFCKELYCAKDGMDALEVLKENEIDAVITDLNMPRLDGLGLLDIIKQKYKKTIVIIVTAHSESNYLLKAIELKADGYILKPLNLQELFSLIIKNAGSKYFKNELDSKNSLLKILRTIGGKRVQIIEHIFNNINEDNQFIGTYDDITAKLNASKPTVVNTFKVLIEDGILSRVKNGQYKLTDNII
ncbi:MAG TPA: response regulator transcription factor, partial [Sulfurospirillum arcachonense]|nr:response regulator transcription factor [Sulfurospirillum arcachonense]